MITSLTTPPKSESSGANDSVKSPLDPKYVKEVLGGFKFTDDELVLVKSALIQQGIDASSEDAKVEYQWRQDIIYERALSYLHPNWRVLRPDLEIYVKDAPWAEYIRQLITAIPTSEYLAQCRSFDVPIPPDWPGNGWIDRGFLPFEFNFLSSGSQTKVWTYEAPKGQGACYALPRQDGDFINLVGMICQSNLTGRACFWDNIDAATGQRIAGRNITLEISRLENGSSLAENCTSCHLGANAFIIHPNVRQLTAVADRDPDVRYQPVGQAGWSNPPPMAALGSGDCATCHEIGASTPSYCATVLANAARRTMPNTANPAGWESPRGPFAGHISALRARCP